MNCPPHTTQPLPEVATFLAILTRIAEALEKQNQLTEELTTATDDIYCAIMQVRDRL